MLKPFLLFTAVVAILCASAVAPARPPQDATAPTAKKPSPEAYAKAKKLYDMDCALCHGPAGDGKSDLAKDMQLTMLDWTDAKSLAGKTDQQLFDAIRKGAGKMPPEDESRAKNDDVRNMVIYIRHFAKEQAAPAANPPAAPAQTPAPPTAPSN